MHTDIILAGITEELGFVGLFAIVLLFGYVLLRLFRIANRVPSKMHYLFCVGVALLLGFSLIINAFGISGITPVKGIAVPFLSYGGSSLIANCIAIVLFWPFQKIFKKKRSKDAFWSYVMVGFEYFSYRAWGGVYRKSS